jgi:hypothetical protein
MGKAICASIITILCVCSLKKDHKHSNALYLSLVIWSRALVNIICPLVLQHAVKTFQPAVSFQIHLQVLVVTFTIILIQPKSQVNLIN